MELSALSLWAGLAVGLAGAWVAIWQGRLAGTSIEIMGRDPKQVKTIRVLTILGIALVESAVIYSLVIAFQILSITGATEANVIGAGLAIGLAWFWAWYGEWYIVQSAIIALNRNPEAKGQIIQYMILFIALAETSAIYGLIIAFKLLNS